MTDELTTRELLARIRGAEAIFKRHQLVALSRGDVELRGAGLYGALGVGIDLVSGTASCRWGCAAGPHVLENVLRRLVNAALGSLCLAIGGYYDEVLATIRVCAESLNLAQLFVADSAQLNSWVTASPTDRQKIFRPVKVREALVRAGVIPAYDQAPYGAL